MRFASLQSVRRSAARALRRFPSALACAWAACAIADGLILANRTDEHLIAAALVLALGIPVFFALTLFDERLGAGASPVARMLPPIAAASCLAAIIWLWPHWTTEIQWRRYLQLSVLAHSLAAFLPYLSAREPRGFWQYNRALLERFVVASIFSSVLMLGLEGALAPLKPLFGITVSAKAFGLLTSWIYLVFHPWFFMAGIPGDLAELDRRDEYPATLKVFAQFILVPLVAVYQVLLSAYLVRVLATGKWPSGLIGWLVSAEAAAGTLAILLVHPVRDRAENVWVRRFGRWFYVALIPSIIMLALAIAKRVAQYGVTEDRYFVIALTVWLAAISVYFIVRRDGDIRLIPATLGALALFTFAGPWSAYGISLASQRARLVKILEANGLWRADRLVVHPVELSLEERRQLSSTLTYLLQTHGSAAVRPVLGDLAAAADSGFIDPDRAPSYERAGRVLARMGIGYVNPWEAHDQRPGGYSFSATTTDHPAATALEGLDYHVTVAGTVTDFGAGARRLELACDARGRRLILSEERPHRATSRGATVADTLATASLDSIIAFSSSSVPSIKEPQRLALQGSGARGFLVVKYLAGGSHPEPRLYGLGGELYFSLLVPAPDSIATGRP